MRSRNSPCSPVIKRQRDDQRHHAHRDAEGRDHRNQRQERLLAPRDEVAEGEEEFEGHQDEAYRLRAYSLHEVGPRRHAGDACRETPASSRSSQTGGPARARHVQGHAQTYLGSRPVRDRQAIATGGPVGADESGRRRPTRQHARIPPLRRASHSARRPRPVTCSPWPTRLDLMPEGWRADFGLRGARPRACTSCTRVIGRLARRREPE